MRKSLEFHRLAKREAREAFWWYAKRSQEVAIRFEQSLKNAFDEIELHPQRWPKYRCETRAFQLRKFPYLVVYLERPIDTVIVAIAHTSRRCGYWKKRI